MSALSEGKANRSVSDNRNSFDLTDANFEPVLWNEYFNIRDDIELEVGTFRIYRRGVEGPLLFFLHGGGFSALTWAVLSTLITEQVKCQCLAVDMRGHGDTKCTDNDDLSVETLAKDIIKIIFAMYPTEAPPIILVGHSMGGAVAVHVACKRTIPSLAGLVVIDVVEGSALSSLRGMTAFLRSRPQHFRSLSHAIEWSIRSSQIRNINSARVSFPGQLKRIETGQTATSELDQGLAIISESKNSNFTTISKQQNKPVALSAITDEIFPEEGEEEEDEKGENPNDGNTIPENLKTDEDEHANHFRNSDTDGPTRSDLPPTHPTKIKQSNKMVLTNPSLSGPNHGVYTWRIDLMKTQPFWQEWFSGLSKLFLSIPEPKLLLLADVDRMDKDLTIGQMQGKFQVCVFPRTGHAVQEDAPAKVAESLARFLVRNRFTEARSNCEL